MNFCERLRATSALRVKDEDAAARPLGGPDKEQDKESVRDMARQIATLQDVFYAERQRKLLIVLQGMDTAGKDGSIRGAFGACDPLGIRAVAFGAPTPAERAHDFLWRVHQHVPARGEIAIFNRSHYEDVLIARVHGWIDEDECRRRYAHIRDFERMLAETGTVILKFFLHISKGEQAARLQARIDDPDKHWKFDLQDLEERKHWTVYQHAYEKAISETDADHAPWYVVPADSKTHRNLAVAGIVLETMQQMKLAFPPARADLLNIRVD